MSDTSLLVAQAVADAGQRQDAEVPAVVDVVQDMLLLYRKPRLAYIITDSTVQILVDGRASAVVHCTGHIAVDAEVPC